MIEYNKNKFDQIVGYSVENWTTRCLPSTEKMIGNYCILEPLNLDLHAPSLFESFQFENQGETWTYLPFGPFPTYGEFKSWLSKICIDKIFFTIIDSKNNLPLGLASFHDINIDHGVIEVGSIHYSKLLQKTCAGTEAMYLMMYRVFEELGYRRYQWRCNALNKNSCLAAERLGFKFEGIFRQSNVFKGHNRDTAWYSIIDSEWPEIKAKFNRWLDKRNFNINGSQILKLQEI